MTNEELVAAAKTMLFQAGAKTAIICTGHEPELRLINDNTGHFYGVDQYYPMVTGTTVLNSLPQVKLYICKHCKCIYSGNHYGWLF